MHGHSYMYPLGTLLAKECTIEWANTAPLITCKLEGGEGLGWTLKLLDSHKNDHYFQKDSNYNDFEFLKGPMNYLLPPYTSFHWMYLSFAGFHFWARWWAQQVFLKLGIWQEFYSQIVTRTENISGNTDRKKSFPIVLGPEK